MEDLPSRTGASVIRVCGGFLAEAEG